MVTTSIRFLTGRAHLHPWQNASTQTDIDWPPSPWRFLRALVAVAGRGLTHLPGDPQIAEPLEDWTMGKMLDSSGNPIPDKVPLSRLALLLYKLAETPPVIWLPRTQIGHLRLFQPDDKGNRSGDRMGSPFLDCFASVDPTSPIYFQWGRLALEDQQKQDLGELLSRLYYFGRAESWCEAELHDHLPDSLKKNETHWECPCIEEADEATRASLGKEHVDYEVKRRLAWEENRLESTMSLLGFGAFKNELSALLLKQSELKRTKKYQETFEKYKKKLSGNNKIKKTKSDLWNEVKIEAKKHLKTKNDLKRQINDVNARLGEFDSNKHFALLRCLLRETGQDRSGSAGLPRPIGTRWVHYAVPREVFRVSTVNRSKPKPAEDFRYNPQSESLPETERVQVVRFALNTNTVHRAVLPNVTATVAVARRIRTVALGIFGKQNQGKLSPQLVGKNTGNPDCPWELFDQNRGDVAPLRDHAAHAHWWLTDEDHDGFLDHLNVVCENGFSRADVAALQSLVKVQQRDGFPDLLLTPIFVGRLDALAVPGFFEPNAKATTFVSATPYFCPIRLKRGKKSGGRPRSLSNPIRKEFGADAEANQIQEILFDYESIHPTATPESETNLGPHFSGSCLKDPDAPCPAGQNSGLYVANQSRFIPSQKFSSTRNNDRTRGPGRMLRITFANPRHARLFALGKFSHFGLGLFVPVSPL